MANPFDDLIPGGAPKGGAFDDLIPAKPREGAISRGIGLGALGFNDAVADTLGAPVDLVNLLYRTAGSPTIGARAANGAQPAPRSPPLGGSQTFRDIFDYVATAPGRVSDAVSQGSLGPLTEPRTARGSPQGLTEDLIYGAGRGIGGAASMFVPAAAVARTMTPNTAGQGVAQALAASPGMQTVAGAVGGGVAEGTGNPYAGMAAGFATPVAGALARRMVTPSMQINDEQQRLAGILRDYGVPMSAGQASGSKGWRTAESVLGNHPLTSWIAGKDSAAQRAAYVRAYSGLTGDAADSITPQYLASTKARIGGGFDEIAARNNVNLDDPFLSDVRNVAGTYGDTLDILRKPIFDKLAARLTGEDKPLLDQAISAITGRQMTGAEYQKLRSRLGQMADSASGSDPEYGRALAGLQRSLDSAMERSVSKGDAAQWRQLRDEYGAYKTIEDAARSTTTQGGDITPTQLRVQAERRNNPRMRDLAEAGQIFVKDTIPNSGTPQRLAMQSLLTGGAIGYGAGAFEPVTAALAFGAPVAAQSVMRGAAGRMTREFPTENLVANALAQRLLLEQQGGQRGR